MKMNAECVDISFHFHFDIKINQTIDQIKTVFFFFITT